MAQAPSPEDNARLLLALFIKHNCRAGETLRDNMILSAFPRQADRVDALDYAEKQGWIEAGRNDSIVLTEAGFAQA